MQRRHVERHAMAASANQRDEGCPRCQGTGGVENLVHPPRPLTCPACGGTGTWRSYRDLRAYRLGVRDGMIAQRNAIPQDTDPMPLDALLGVLDGQETEDYWDGIPEDRDRIDERGKPKVR